MTSSRRSPIWHPYTQHGAEPAEIEISRSEGAWLETASGTRIFDAISSWWVTTHGHNHPRIVDAIQRQAATLDQVIFAGFTHTPAERVASALVDITPPPLQHVFFSDSGSTSVEVALKMALGYWRNRGEDRTRILALEHAYHGDTVGSMSAGARGIFTDAYAPLLFDVGRVPFPAAGTAQRTLDALESACKSGDVAAFICEPLVLGAGGMLMYDATVLTELRNICARYRVLFIADEVLTGFGRTGRMFACNHADVAPDFLCLAKGLSGGTLPLAATLTTHEIYDAHRSADRARMFFHSSSFTANPIACAAAAANLDIWQSEPVLERIAALQSNQARHLHALQGNANVHNPRQCGTIAAFDVGGESRGYLAKTALVLRSECLKRGVLVRPLGNTMYVMPPYCTTSSDLEVAYEAICEAMDVGHT